MLDRYRLSAAALPLLLFAASSGLEAAKQYPNVKGYADFLISPQPFKTFSYAGKGLTWSNPATGVYRIAFEDLAAWTYRPTLQLTARGSASNGNYQTCGGSLEVEGSDLVVLATCKRNGLPAQMAFTAMIFDETSDAAYVAVPSCSTCPWPGPRHNPSTENTPNAVRIERFDNRTGVFFRLDSPSIFEDAPFPMAFVTPIATNSLCQIYSVGSSRQRADEFGIEVRCHNEAGQPMNTSFNLLLVPPSEQAAYVLTRDDSSPWPGYVTNAGGEPVLVQRQSVGRYHVTIPALTQNWADDGTVKVNAHGGTGTTCAVGSFYRSGGGLEVDVVCHNTSRALADSRFILLATSRH